MTREARRHLLERVTAGVWLLPEWPFVLCLRSAWAGRRVYELPHPRCKRGQKR